MSNNNELYQNYYKIISKKKKQLAIATKALEFYAKPNTVFCQAFSIMSKKGTMIETDWADCSDTARQALTEIKDVKNDQR